MWVLHFTVAEENIYSFTKNFNAYDYVSFNLLRGVMLLLFVFEYTNCEVADA
jgi:hypothetical protein